MGGSDGNVLDEEIASAPPRNAPRASMTMSVVEGVSFAQIGTRATSFTTCVTMEMSSVSLPMFEPMSLRSMCGHDRFSSSALAPSSWHAFASVCQWRSSSSLPEPAMIEATSTRSGCAALICAILGTHQSSGLSEISSQFHDEWRAVPGTLLHREVRRVRRRAEKLRLRAVDVDDRMQADGLGDDAAPARIERTHDIAVGFGRRGRGEQERVLESEPRERDTQLRSHKHLDGSGNYTPIMSAFSGAQYRRLVWGGPSRWKSTWLTQHFCPILSTAAGSLPLRPGTLT